MSATFPLTDSQGRSYRIDSHGNKLYGTSSQQTAVNTAWAAYWNGQGPNPNLTTPGTYYTGLGVLAKEAPDATSRQAAADFAGVAPVAAPVAPSPVVVGMGGQVQPPLPTAVTVDKTASLLDVMTANGVQAQHYADVVKRNGGRTVVDAGGTVQLPPGQIPFGNGVANTPSTNALNALAGSVQGASGASSVFPRDERNYSLNGVASPATPANKQTPFQRDLAKTGLPQVWNDIGAAVQFQKANIAKVVGSVQGAGQGYVKNQEELLWNIKNTASLYFTGQGATPLVRGEVTPASGSPPQPANTGWGDQFVNPKDETTDSLIAALPANAREERNYLLATDLPVDKYALERIEQVKALRALTVTGDDLPTSIPLQVAILTWGEQGINKLLSATGLDIGGKYGKWAKEGQSLVWKPDSITPTPESNSEPFNGIYQIPDEKSNAGGWGGAGYANTGYAQSAPTGVAVGFLNLRLAAG